MSFFPDQIMPKMLRKETAQEVDNNPLLYNARDYNIHHREIRAIERMLLGSLGEAGVDSASEVISTIDPVTGGGAESGSTSVSELLSRFVQIIELLTNQGFAGTYSGTIQTGGKIPIPENIASTQTVGTVSVSDATVTVASTQGFPASGIITKFNRLDTTQLCTDGNPPGGGSRCALGSRKIQGYAGLISGGFHATNQELISYTSKTNTTFNGCTRSVNSSTAQQATDASPALVINGRAAVSFGHNMWGRGGSGRPNQFVLSHDALLRVSANLLGYGSRTKVGNVLQDHIEISWILSAVGYYESVDINQLFNAVD